MSEYGIEFADWCEFPPETMVGETVFDGEGNAIGWIVNAKAGRSCVSCPEMDNPDSYVMHLQSALKWHDEHVPRPTNPRNTCVVLNGQNPPDEVLFVRDEGGVTHYLPEDVTVDAGMCRNERPNRASFKCSECGGAWYGVGDNIARPYPRYCPSCGRRIVEVDE